MTFPNLAVHKSYKTPTTSSSPLPQAPLLVLAHLCKRSKCYRDEKETSSGHIFVFLPQYLPTPLCMLVGAMYIFPK